MPGPGYRKSNLKTKSIAKSADLEARTKQDAVKNAYRHTLSGA